MFTIITVTYNAEKLVRRTMESVRQQTYPNIEHVIVDGASTDGTLDILRPYLSKQVHLISEPDKGIYDAMNKAIAMASGNYLWFLNAGDELYAPDTVLQIANMLTAPMPQVIYGETSIVDIDGNFLYARRLQAPPKLTWRSFRHGMLVCHQSFIVHRSVCVPYDLAYRFSSDFDWCIRVMKQSQSLLNTQLVLSKYLNEGATTRNMKASLKERYHIMCKHYGTLPTIVRHLWFAVRFAWSRFVKNEV